MTGADCLCEELTGRVRIRLVKTADHPVVLPIAYETSYLARYVGVSLEGILENTGRYNHDSLH